MGVLNRAAILAAPDRVYVEVDVPEWGGKVRLQSLDAEQTLSYEGAMDQWSKGEKGTSPIAMLVTQSVVDENGALLFTGDDVAALMKKSPRAYARIVKAALKLNQIEKEKDVGNSVASRTDG